MTKWSVWCESDGETELDGVPISCDYRTAVDAAEAWARIRYRHDPGQAVWLGNASKAVVCVQRIGGDLSVQKVTLTRTWVQVFHATMGVEA